MADVEHGDNLPSDHASGDKGNHTVESWNSVLDEAARIALLQVAVDRGREIFQTAGVQPGWYRALGVTGKWVAIAGPGGIPFPTDYITGLVASQNAANPTFQMDISVGSARSDDDSFNFMLTSILTADITGPVGVNGLDAGVEASSTWYSIWVICDSTDVNPLASLLSLSVASPTLPVGYDKKRRAGWVRNDAGSNFIPYKTTRTDPTRQIRYDTVDQAIVNVLSGGTATVFANVDLSALVPPTVELADLLIAHEGAAVTDGVRLRPDGETVADPATRVFAGASSSPSSISSMELEMRCSTSQIIEYENFSAADPTDIWVLGYADSL